MGNKGESRSVARRPPGREAAVVFLTWRSLLLGILMCFLIGVAGPYWDFYLRTNSLFSNYGVPGAIFFTFIILLFYNGLVRFARPGLALKGGELAAVAAMMMIGCAIAGGLPAYLMADMTGAYYYATPSNQWQEKLWPHLVGWLSPLDQGGGTSAITKFYMGLRAGEPIPWRPWIKPLLLWAVFLPALYMCMMSIMAIMRKQWVEHERLTFPIAQVVQELCDSAEDPWGRLSILRSYLFWAGLAVPLLVGSLNSLHGYFPVVGQIRTLYDFPRGLVRFRIAISFAVLGFTFLIPNRIALSIWLLNLLSFLARWQVRKYGLAMQENLMYGAGEFPRMAHMGMGAVMMFVAAGLWLSRRHLARVFRCALGIGQGGYDAGEPCSYRKALFLLAATTLVAVVWLWHTGLSLSHSILFLSVAMMILFAMARVVSQCGFPHALPPMIAPCFMTSSIGAGNIAAPGIASLIMNFHWSGKLTTSVMSSSAHGMYLARRKGRGLLWAMMLGIAVTAVSAVVVSIYLSYRHGAVNLHQGVYRNVPLLHFGWAMRAIEFGGRPNPQGYFWTGVGFAVMGALVSAQRMLPWWPIHPVGFVVCSVNWTDAVWFTVFLAWLSKLLVTRLGGTRHFRLARRFFLGMILGDFAGAGLWAIIDTVTGKVGNAAFFV